MMDGGDILGDRFYVCGCYWYFRRFGKGHYRELGFSDLRVASRERHVYVVVALRSYRILLSG